MNVRQKALSIILKDYKTTEKINVKELSDRVDVSVATIYKILRGDKVADETLSKIEIRMHILTSPQVEEEVLENYKTPLERNPNNWIATFIFVLAFSLIIWGIIF